MRACSGVWVAHGAGTADRADGRPARRAATCRPPIRATGSGASGCDADEERGYYYGFANEGLWPLCHRAHVQPVFRSADFEHVRGGERAIRRRGLRGSRTATRPLVLVQDYHFALAPRMIRAAAPAQHDRRVLAHSLAASARLRDLPVGPAAARGLLGSSIVGFQTPDDCRNFVDTVERSLDAHVNRDAATSSPTPAAGRACAPIRCRSSGRAAGSRQSPPIETCRDDGPPASSVCRRIVRLGVGVDRLDYTKGINEKFLAVERLLETQPDIRERFVFVQIAEPSRDCLPAYRDLRARVRRHGRSHQPALRHGELPPIVLLEAHHEPAGGLPIPARRRCLLRRQPARRDEPGREGIRRARATTSAACWCSASSPARPRELTAR